MWDVKKVNGGPAAGAKHREYSCIGRIFSSFPFLKAVNKKQDLRLKRGKQREGAAFHLSSASEAFKNKPSPNDLSRWNRGSRNTEHVFPSQFGSFHVKRHYCEHRALLKSTGQTRLIPQHFKGYSMPLEKKRKAQKRKQRKCNLYGLGEGSHFKSEMKENRKEIFGNIAQSDKLPVQKIFCSQKRPFSHQMGKSDKRQTKEENKTQKQSRKKLRQGTLQEVWTRLL